MSQLLPVSLLLGLTVAAFTGPALLRRAAPALSRHPRAAIALLLSSGVLWIVALLALGPLLAWYLSGPALLPEPAARVCQRCIDAAGPLSGDGVSTALPVLPLIVLPAAGALLLAARTVHRMAAGRRAARTAAAALMSGGVAREVAGHRVVLIPQARPMACALPRRLGGVVLSDGALRVLARDELRAVVAHENAHLRQRHHLVAEFTDGLGHVLRWVPLIAAVCDAIPHYLEIAADDAARAGAGTPALAAALLKLGEPAPGGPGAAAPAPGLLHAAGPERIRHLVAPAAPRRGAGAALTAAAQAGFLAALGASVYVPYAGAVLTGCA